mgnify:CR=1 FL=1
MIKLNDDNFFVYAVKNYYSPGSIGTKDITDDLNRIKYIKRLLNRYKKTGDANERLILNHLVILYNVFNDAATDMLFFKLEEEHWPDLKTYLVYLHRMPLETVTTKGIKETDIKLNEELIQVLRSL